VVISKNIVKAFPKAKPLISLSTLLEHSHRAKGTLQFGKAATRCLVLSTLFLFTVLHSTAQENEALPSFTDQADSIWQSKTFLQKATSIPPKPNQGRVIAVSALYATGWTAALTALNKTWYAGFEKSKFHAYDDSREWLQVDKVGHTFSAYRLSLGYSSILQWSGVDKDKSVYIGAVSGIVSQSVIEILDGYSAKWGFSWSDMGANVLGSGMYAGQHALWGEQRVLFKFSTHKNIYPEGVLRDRANALYGTSVGARIFKDYNAQTYWLSANLKSFLPQSKLPKWLNLAVGYGARGMYGGYENTWTDENGLGFDRSDVPRLRQFYLSPDIDLSRIQTKSKFLKGFLSTFNLKIPLPTLELNSDGSLKFHALYF